MMPQLQEREELVKLISDKHARKIIDSIQKKSKSAIQISRELDLELSTTYRRLQKLQKHRLLKITFKITSDGKKSFYYQSKVNSIIAKYQQGNFYVNLDYNHI